MNYWAAADAWLTNRRATGRVKDLTQTGYKRNLESFASHIGHDRDIATVTTADIEAWIASFGTENPGSIRTKTSPVRQVFAWARRQDWITVDPCHDLTLPRLPDNPPRALSRADFDRVIHVASNRSTVFRDTTIVIVAYGLGLRISELARMMREHYDPERATLRIWRKGGKIRDMPVEGAAQVALDDWITYGLWGATRGPMWPSLRRQGQNLERNYIGVLMKQRAADVGVRMTAHETRHSRATYMAQDGVPQSIIQEFLDHATAEMTARYTRATKDDVRRWMAEVPDYVDFDRVRAATGIDRRDRTKQLALDVEAVTPGPDWAQRRPRIPEPAAPNDVRRDDIGAFLRADFRPNA